MIVIGKKSPLKKGVKYDVEAERGENWIKKGLAEKEKSKAKPKKES